MTRVAPRTRLFAPLVHAAALLLLLEEWCWKLGLRLGAWLGRTPGLAWVEVRVRTLPPYAALCAFLLPGLLLLPVKMLALVAIAKGHAASGITTIVVAKLGGAAVVARLYALTLPTLLAVGWFARCHGWFMGWKIRTIDQLRAYLRASAAFAKATRLLRGIRIGWRRRRRRRVRSAIHFGGRNASPASRVLRRFVVQWRARRRADTD
ncbi:hypothetical protein [Herbaspirillum sp. SJZ107]|uniref:hypothetical protein n=1 Tax=Herbaspirillum sp. SJZ107 TaxID=2572881 RepID=UPI0011518EE8|nr:hypothetical protein [Herbaspirillum sp. SJZ107]TQK07542.1 hypothetical protein FBX97_2826 [Herbaspirillum sp. SJZ107]